MDLNRNSIKARAFVERNWLPAGWVIDQDGTGRYVKVSDTNDSSRTIFHAANWPSLLGFCEGVNAGRAHAEAAFEKMVAEQLREEHLDDEATRDAIKFHPQEEPGNGD